MVVPLCNTLWAAMQAARGDGFAARAAEGPRAMRCGSLVAPRRVCAALACFLRSLGALGRQPFALRGRGHLSLAQGCFA